MTRILSLFMKGLMILFGVVLMADFAMAQLSSSGYLALFTPAQQAYFAGLPVVAIALWGGQAAASFGGALMVAARVPAAPGIMGLAFVLNVALTVWLLVISTPTMQSVTGWFGAFVMICSVSLTLIFWLFARLEKVQMQR